MRLILRKVKILISLLFFATVGTLQAQIIDVGEEKEEDRKGSGILDDTTKQVYGPTTTSYIYQHNLKYNSPDTFTIDTTIFNMHKYQYLAQQDYKAQDLGNIGTATQPVFYNPPATIGRRSGFSLYDNFMINSDEAKYYNTKSPYSRFYIIWGGQGRAITEATYTRNIDARSNIGFDFKGFFIDKQVQRSGRGDRRTRGTHYTFYGNYMTKNGKYKLLGNFVRGKHNVNEYGGIFINDDEPLLLQYFDDNREGILDNAQTQELRTNYHLYHQYELTNYIQLYHEFDRYKQQNDFIDQLTQDDSTYFDFIVVDSTDVKDRSKMVYIQNEVGIKGDIGPTFYNIYYKVRDVSFRYKYLDLDTVGNIDGEVLESYGGANLRFGNDSTRYISAYGEYLVGGNFKLGGEIVTDWFEAYGSTASYMPSYIHQAYRGSHDVWTNDFESLIVTTLGGEIKLKIGDLYLRPGLKNQLISKYIYFASTEETEANPQTVLPEQAGADINLLMPQFRFDMVFWKRFHFKLDAIYTIISGASADAISIPDLYAHGQLYYHSIDFDGNLEWMFGVDGYYKSSYYADGYDPAIMNFYRQNYFEVESYPIIDVFLDAKINRGRFFLKYNNLYDLMSDTGYFTTPEYPGQSSIFDFGFNWAFYD